MSISRRKFVSALMAFTAGGLSACVRADEDEKPEQLGLAMSKEEWKKVLPPDAYSVLFEEATEPPFSSPLNHEKRSGNFICAACNLPLFESAKKYDSRTGWPSFWEEIAGAVGTKKDYKLILPRVEYHCSRCGGHQGHIFDDGPQPTGLRYCNNGLALKFVPEAEALPALRT